MTLKESHRKLLWGRSAGCCSLCKCRLTQDETTANPAVVLGEEAHIVSSRADGPRYRPMEPGEVDHYSNIILLCRNDHIRVDRQPRHFTESLLLEIKADHEKWAKQRQEPHRPMQLKDVEPGGPTVYPLTTGGELAHVVAGSHALQYSKPDDLSGTEMEMVSGFLQSMSDWIDIWSDLNLSEHLRAELTMAEELEGLRTAGFTVYGGIRHQVLEGGAVETPSPWKTAVIIVERVEKKLAGD